MTATVTDDRRRVVMPPELPAKSAVTIQRIDEDTWIVKRQRDQTNFSVFVVPIIKDLPDDPEWEKVEAAFAADAFKKLPPPEE